MPPIEEVMRYLRARWLHQHPDEPVELYSERDEDSHEIRMDFVTGFCRAEDVVWEE